MIKRVYLRLSYQYFGILILLLVFCVMASGSCNERPVIGIVGQTITNEEVLKRYPFGRGRPYIAASYVKFIEAAGARVLLIDGDSPTERVQEILEGTNGILFPGGDANLFSSGYENVAETAFDYIQKKKEEGEIYPMMAICLGLQQEAVLTAQKNILRKTDSHNIGLPMAFTMQANTSQFFRGLPDSIRRTLTSTRAAFNNHHYSVLMETFKTSYNLNQFYNVLSTSKDRQGVEFVASMEARNFPIFGFQWHPEKTLFEWDFEQNVDRSLEAIYASQHMSNRFVWFARQNCNRFSPKLEDNLSYNYRALFTGDISSFQQIYII